MDDFLLPEIIYSLREFLFEETEGFILIVKFAGFGACFRYLKSSNTKQDMINLLSNFLY